MTNAQLLATAYHEAGHVVIAHRLGLPLGDGGVSIVADRESAGRAHIPYHPPVGQDDGYVSDELRLYVEKHVMTLLAGIEAQRKFNPRSVRRHHPHDDYKEAVDLLGDLFETKVLALYINFLLGWARQKVRSKSVWAQIVAVAEALYQRQRLAHDEVIDILKRAIDYKHR